jgi:hypothetical protein
MPVWCANASDGIITAQPYMNKNKPPRDIKGKHGAPFGETILCRMPPRERQKRPPIGGRNEPFEKKIFYRRSVTKFVVSTTTRNNVPGTYVRLWHLADINTEDGRVRFWGQSGHPCSALKCPLMTQTGHSHKEADCPRVNENTHRNTAQSAVIGLCSCHFVWNHLLEEAWSDRDVASKGSAISSDHQ